jgi:hypothetical protein
MSEQDDNFEKIYPLLRSMYEDLVYKDKVPPMQVFGVFLGIIAQEFKEHSTEEKFKEFLDVMKEQEWKKDVLQ